MNLVDYLRSHAHAILLLVRPRVPAPASIDCHTAANRRLLALACALLAATSLSQVSAADSAGPEPRWWKGNLHTHSLWSDGDDFPEMIIDWYKRHGYDFLALSDHNVIQLSERWIALGTNKSRALALDKYRQSFGTNWVQTRVLTNRHEVRLKPLSEYRALFEEPQKFLLIPSKEITDRFRRLPVHMNASNIRDPITPQGGNSVREVMQNNVNAVREQRERTGQRMILHLNHPNFVWGVTAEDIAAVQGEQFFEVYNGHPSVNDEGDHRHPSTDRLWDIALTLRLASGNSEPLFGIGVDDSHHYHEQGPKRSNSGRGWINVRARFLTPELIINAMERGDFYASSGVELEEVRRTPTELGIKIKASPGVTYRTKFIGTRRGVIPRGEPVKDNAGNTLPVTFTYSDEVGAVLAEVEGAAPTYRSNGDELYVRAKIISSKPKQNPGRTNEVETAWTQPIFPQAAHN